MRRTKDGDTNRIGPLRTIVREVIGSDGLVYEQLDCTHRLLLIPTDYKRGTEFRRHCSLCQKAMRPTLINS